MNSKLLLISMLVCFVAADVSEILRRPSSKFAQRKSLVRVVPQRKLQARNTDPALESELLAQELLSQDLPEQSVESGASFQLTASHQDFQAPYHYEKPVVAVVANDPIVENDYLPPVNNDYLPPVVAADTLAKRHAKFRVRL